MVNGMEMVCSFAFFSRHMVLYSECGVSSYLIDFFLIEFSYSLLIWWRFYHWPYIDVTRCMSTWEEKWLDCLEKLFRN